MNIKVRFIYIFETLKHFTMYNVWSIYHFLYVLMTWNCNSEDVKWRGSRKFHVDLAMGNKADNSGYTARLLCFRTWALLIAIPRAILITNLLLHILKGILRPCLVNVCDNDQLIASNFLLHFSKKEKVEIDGLPQVGSPKDIHEIC